VFAYVLLCLLWFDGVGFGWTLEQAQQCPFITRLYGAFETDTHLFMVMER
jgi:hypothetical protein